VPTTLQLCRYKVSLEAVYAVFRLLQLVPANTFPCSVVKDPAYIYRMEALTTMARKREQQLRVASRKGKAARSGKSVATNTQAMPLLDVLEILRHHSASDPHDKVYAALGFASESSQHPVEVEYRKSFAAMLRDVAISCVHEENYNLRFLGHAGLLGSIHMPASWIPDWL
jgi:hypothetical protein